MTQQHKETLISLSQKVFGPHLTPTIISDKLEVEDKGEDERKGEMISRFI